MIYYFNQNFASGDKVIFVDSYGIAILIYYLRGIVLNEANESSEKSCFDDVWDHYSKNVFFTILKET